jgi:hypothetical protein
VGDGPGELYAKVVDEPLEDGAGFVVRFTAMAPELARYVHGRLE